MIIKQSLHENFPYDLVVVIAPHPDDSCIALGGFLARLAHEKPACAVHVFVMTSGHRGVSDRFVELSLSIDPPPAYLAAAEIQRGLAMVRKKQSSELSSEEARALAQIKQKIRQAEVEEEAQVLHFTPHFLNLELYDQHAISSKDRATMAAALQKVHSGVNRVIIQPGFFDAHMTHKLCSRLTGDVVDERFPGAYDRWTYESPWTQTHVRADIILPIPEPAFQKKLEATRAHRSQGERSPYDRLAESLAIRNAAVMSEVLGSFNIDAAYELGKYVELMARQPDRVIYS